MPGTRGRPAIGARGPGRGPRNRYQDRCQEQVSGTGGLRDRAHPGLSGGKLFVVFIRGVHRYTQGDGAVEAPGMRLPAPPHRAAKPC